MKKVAYALLSMIFLSLSACKNEEEEIVPPVSEETLSKVEKVFAQHTWEVVSGFPFMLKEDQNILRSSRAMAWTEFGPYTKAATLTKIQTNYKMVVAGIPTMPTALYFCDVYSSEVVITLPSGALLNVTGTTKNGYNNYTTMSSTPKSYKETKVGDTYYITTYSIIPKYNSSGQAVSYGTLPQDLTGNVITYTYLQNI